MGDEDRKTGAGDGSQAFIESLKDSGFLNQLKDLEKTIRTISDDLRNLGRLATQRVEETENLAAHLLAVEAVLAVLLKTHPVDPETIKATVKEMTAELSGVAEGSPAVHAVVDDLLARVKG